MTLKVNELQKIKNDLQWITSSKKSKALIINVKYSDEVLY